MPGATFVAISADDLIEFLHDREFVETNPWGKERCFTQSATIGKMPVRIYFLTTLSVDRSVIRKVGSDAMRMWVMGADPAGMLYRISYTRTFHRTKGWKQTITKAMKVWEELVKWRCYGCLSPLVRLKAESKEMQCVWCNYQR